MMLSILAKVTATLVLGLFAAWLARRSRAALRHALLAATFGVVSLMPIASLIVPSVRIAVPISVPHRIAPPRDITLPATDADPGPGPAPAIPSSFSPSLSGLLVAAWSLGAMLFLLPMAAGLRQVSSVCRSGLPWREGQALVDALAFDAGIHRRVEVLLHESLAGPMTCGVMRPAIVLAPDAQIWEAEDLNRALVHELEHVRRFDWLGHCVGRAVCALYWFHPLVWIAWRQLSLEAERCCDDAVLGRSEPTAYADQLVGLARRLSTAKSPLLAMANRADLAARVGAVLDSRQRRGRAGALLVALACAAAAVLVLSMSPLRMVAAQSAADATPEFEAVSVKLIDSNMQGEHSHEHTDDPLRLSMMDSMHRLILRAYGILEAQLGGEPDWFRSRLYSIEAVTAAPANSDRMMLMLRGVLAERFQLKLRQEERDFPVYALEVAAGGPKFKELKPGEVPKDQTAVPGIYARSFTSIADLMNSLNRVFDRRLSLDRPVVDRTHLNGNYYILFQTEMQAQTDDAGRRTLQYPNLVHDLQSQLGLKLTPARARMPYFVVEHAAAPTPN